MTTAFASEATITAPADRVWEVLTDWDAAPAWMSGIDTLEADGPTDVGTTLRFRARGRDRATTIVEVADGHRVVLRSTQGAVTARYAYEVEAVDSDTSRLRLTADCDVRGPMGLLAPLVRRTLARTDAGQPAALRAVVEAD